MKFIINQVPHKYEESEYRVQDLQVDNLVDSLDFNAAIAVLTQMKQDFPDRLADTLGYLIWIYSELKQPLNKLVQITEGVEKNIFYKLDHEFYSDGIAALPEFQKLQEICLTELAKLTAHSESELELYMPKDCFNGETLLILHGDGSTNMAIKEIWSPQTYLDKGVAVAYLQSPTRGGSHHYFWTSDYVKSRETIEQAFDMIFEQIKVNASNITLAGYSGGAMAAISSLTYGNIQPKQVLAFMPHFGEYVGNTVCQHVPIFIFKAEFDENIDALLTALTPLANDTQAILNGVAHGLPTDIDSYVLPCLNQSN